MVERRLAPFWKGLQDFEESWGENQIVAVVRGEEMPKEPGPAVMGEALGGGASMLTVPGTTTPYDRPRSPSNPEHGVSNVFGSPPSSSFRTM